VGKASVNGAQFGALLNMKFHDPDYMTRKHVAAELDIGESTFSEYVRMDRNFPPDLTPAELQEIAHAYEECVEKMAAVVASARAQAGVKDGGIL
jgi:predicted transcriptional regulator